MAADARTTGKPGSCKSDTSAETMADRTPRGRVATPRACEYFNREQPRRQPRLF